MFAYVMIRSFGISAILLCGKTKRQSVPIVLVCLSPCAKLQKSLPNAVVQIGRVQGSLASVWYREMEAPVTG